MLKEVKIEVTNLCYRNCIHCSSNATCNENDNLFLDKNLVKNIIDQACEMGARSIAFTGGEATLYPDLIDVVKYAKQKGLTTKLYSLCYRTNANIELLKELNNAGLNELIYSTATSLIIGKELSTYSIEDFVKILSEESTLSIGFHHVVTSKTIDHLEDIPKYIDAAGKNFAKLSFLRYVPHGRGDISLVPSAKQMIIFKKELSALRQLYGDGIRTGSPFNILNVKHTPCNAADETMIIGFDGKVYPCDAMKYFDYMGSGGNALKQNLSEIYNSPYFQNIRIYKDIHSEKCKGCNNYAICRSGCLGQKMIYVTSTDGAKTLEWYEINAKRTMNNFSTDEVTRINAETGVFGGTGILVNDIKKILTHDCNEEGKEYLKQLMILKVGDIIWYIAASLSKTYNISFNDIGGYLINGSNTKTSLITEQVVKKCSSLEDPDCPFSTINRRYNIAELDALFMKKDEEFDLNKFWKKLVSVSAELALSERKKKVTLLASKLLLILGEFSHYYLNTTLEEVMTYNVLKLQEEHPEGFESRRATNKIINEAKTKTLINNESNKKK